QYSMYQHNNDDGTVKQLLRDANYAVPEGNVRDGYTKDITFIAGINTPDGRGNATVYVGYRKLDPITQNKRDFSSCALGSSAAGNPAAHTFACGGSANTALGLFQTYNPNDPNDLIRPARSRSIRTARCATSRPPTSSTSRRTTSISARTSARRPAC